jgi:hypothetical protein
MAISMNGVNLKGGVSMKKATAGFDPVTFWSGYNGGFWDFTNPANLFADPALTVPATLNAGGDVQGVTDLTGLGNKLIQWTNGVYFSSFTMRSGYCETYVGGLATPAPGISIGNAYTYVALFRPSNVAVRQNLVDSDYGVSNRIAQAVVLYETSNMASYIFGYTVPLIVMPSPTLSVGTDYYSAVAVNGTNADLSVAGTTYTTGGGTPGGAVAPVAVGATFGGTVNPVFAPFSGRLYCAAMITKKCTPQEVQDIGNYMNTLAGTSATV